MSTQRACLSDDSPAFRRPRTFRLLRRLSCGPWADVYEAEDGRGEGAQLKIRAGHARAGQADRRLLREAAALASIRHPSVIPVLDVGFAGDGRAFFVMPKLEGASLRELLVREGHLSPRRAARLVADVLDGLEAAHRAGVVHCDVRPDNVMVQPGAASRERAILLDFSIAEVDGVSDDRAAGDLVGTPTYLAPERILGEPADARTDIYAAATMLFEAITGRPPFDAKGPFERMRAHVRDEPLRLRDHAVVPAELDQAVRRALAREPDLRFATAQAFARALRRAFEPAREPSQLLRAS